MRTLLVVLVMLTLFGCASLPCPKEDVILATPEGLVVVPKGFCDEQNKGQSWIPRSEFEELMKKHGGY